MDKFYFDSLKRQGSTEDIITRFSRMGAVTETLRKLLNTSPILNSIGFEQSRLASASLTSQAASAKLMSTDSLRHTTVPSWIGDAVKLQDSVLSKNMIALSTSSHMRSIADLASRLEVGSALKHINVGNTVRSAHIGEAIERLAPALSTKFLASHALGQFKNLSTLLHLGNGFGEGISNTLRVSLGDWRGQLAASSASQFMYEKHGFDKNLTSFPSEVFYEVVSEAGFTDASTDIELFGPVVKDIDDKNLSQIELNTRSYARLYQLEKRLRSFINDAMIAKHGHGWVKFIPRDVRDNLQEIQERKKGKGEERTLIECTDFSHYAKILLVKDLWRDVFSPLFRTHRMEDVRESLNRLKPVRDVAMHCNDVSHEDWLTLRFETSRLLSVMG